MSYAAPMTTLCSRDLRALRQAGVELLEVMQSLQRKGRNVVTELLPNGRAMAEWDHYPASDAFDADTGCRWYYHTHPDTQRGDEHGHFHLFARASKTGYTHLLCLSVSAAGLPLRAFTTNRWVTNEAYAPAGVVLRRLQQFSLRKPAALTLVHRWLAAVVGVFGPQLAALLAARDRRVDAALITRPNLFEDRRTMLLSQCHLDLQQQMKWLDEVSSDGDRQIASPVRRTKRFSREANGLVGTRGAHSSPSARSANAGARATHNNIPGEIR